MSTVNAGQRFSFGVTYDSPSLFVAAKIYDDSGASPVLLSTVPMNNYFGNSYRGNYTQSSPTSLLIQKSVYTDGTYTTVDSNYSQADETQQVVAIIPTPADIASAVWDALTSAHDTAGTFGFQVQQTQVSGTGVIGVIQDQSLIGVVDC